MKLNLRDRFVLVQMLPQVGKLKEVKLSKDMTEKLMPSQEEVDEFEISQNEGMISWTPGVDTTKDIELSEDEELFLKAQFIKLDEESKIEALHAEMIERLFEGSL